MRCRAIEDLRAVQGRYDAVDEGYRRAVDAYRDDPTDKQAKVVREARERRDLLDLELERPRQKVEAAEQALAAANAAAAAARHELERAQEEGRISALRERASLAQFHARTRAAGERLVQAKGALEQAAREVIAELEASNSAVDELRSLGLDATPLESRQLLACAYMVMAEKDRSLIEGILRVDVAPPADFSGLVLAVLTMDRNLDAYRNVGGATPADLQDFFSGPLHNWHARATRRRTEGAAIEAPRTGAPA
jgi:hypothetical protein